MLILKKLKRIRLYARDACNIFRYGRIAPLTSQQLIVDPARIEYVYYGDLREGELPESLQQGKTIRASPLGGRAASGLVLDGDWDSNVIPLHECPKYQVCRNRFISGMSWVDAGAYDLMRKILKEKPGADGCRSMADVIKRYEEVDYLYHTVKKEGRLKSRKELRPENFRESGGVYVHIDRRGDIIFGGGGWHRLIVAQMAGLRSIPAQLGVVHLDAIQLFKKKSVNIQI